MLHNRATRTELAHLHELDEPELLLRVQHSREPGADDGWEEGSCEQTRHNGLRVRCAVDRVGVSCQLYENVYVLCRKSPRG